MPRRPPVPPLGGRNCPGPTNQRTNHSEEHQHKMGQQLIGHNNEGKDEQVLKCLGILLLSVCLTFHYLTFLIIRLTPVLQRLFESPFFC